MADLDVSTPAAARRTICRTKLTKYATKIREMDPETTEEAELLKLCEIERTLSSQIAELDVLIEERLDPTDCDKLDHELRTQDKYNTLLAELKVFIRKCKSVASPALTGASTSVPASALTMSVDMHKKRIKLPVIEIPVFDGDLIKWYSFSKMFDEMIHQNTELSTSSKFHYLQHYLSGNAKKQIAGLCNSDDNYEIALELLREHYHRPDKVEELHLRKMLQVKPVRNIDDTSGARRILEVFHVNLRALDALSIPRETYCRQAYNALVNAVPKEISRQTVIRQNRERNVEKASVRSDVSIRSQGLSAEPTTSIKNVQASLDALLSDLQEYVDANETLEGSSGSTTEKQIVEKPREYNTRSTSRSSPAPAQPTIAFTTQTKRRCAFCGGDHALTACRANLNINLKREKAIGAGLCFKCLTKGHTSRNCHVAVICNTCGKRHHTLMHDDVPGASGKAVVNNVAATADAVSTMTLSNVVMQGTVRMETALVRAKCADGSCDVRVLFDTGSASSFVRDAFAIQHKFTKTGDEMRSVLTLGSDVPQKFRSPTYRVTLEDVRGNRAIDVNLIGIPQLNDAVKTLPCIPRVLAKQAKGLTLADRVGVHCDVPLEILLGADVLPMVYTDDAPVRINPTVIARNTVFGHVFLGAIEQVSAGSTAIVNLCLTPSAKCAAEALWNLEAVGVATAELTFDEGVEAVKRFEQSVERKDGRYWVEIPVTNDINHLGSNYSVAENRLRHQVATLTRVPGRRELYEAALKKYQDGGFVERIPRDEMSNRSLLYYMPHHAVYRPESESTPIRIVFDCSSHAHGQKSLNDCVDTGPNLNRNIVDLLLRFREGAVAMTADIAKAFLQIMLKPALKDLFRYVWQEDNALVHWRFRTLPFGCNASPFLLMATLRHHFAQQPASNLLDKLRKCFYMDDMVLSVRSIDEALQLKQYAIELLQDAGMQITKWNCNQPPLWDDSTTDEPVSKVLGVCWDRVRDEFMFSADKLKLDAVRLTKRKMLSLIASIYDPLGALGPIVCAGKVHFQETCRESTKWSDPVPPEIEMRFVDWAEQLPRVAEITFKRFVNITDGTTDVQLHVFTDFSPKAYAAVAYLRVVDQDGVVVSFLMGRHRLAPLHSLLSVPKGELMGALIGARLAAYLHDTLTTSISRIVMWTDATVVLAWLRNDPVKYTRFVANRLVELQVLSKKLSLTWRHCPGVVNPADLSTRGITVDRYLSEGFWLAGPDFLRLDADEWPMHDDESIPDTDDELRPAVLVATTVDARPDEVLINLADHSYEWRARKIASLVLRFVVACRPHCQAAKLKPDDVLLLQLQRDMFCTERRLLLKGEPVNRNSKLKPYRVEPDDKGLLRIVTRLSGIAVTYDEQRPIVLANHPFLRAMVRARHIRLMHCGVVHLMAEMRHHYYVIQLRKICRQIVRDCTVCRRYRTTKPPLIAAPLPDVRQQGVRVFQYVGVDFTGPFYTRSGDSAEKSYVALYTCLVTRAVHLEVVSRISTEAFLNSLRRFIASRQVPDVIYSDNATAFVKARGELNLLFSKTANTATKQFAADRGIQWRFSTPYAPWTGGAWERMMRTFKGPLRKTIGTRRLTYEQLHTVLKEAEALVNSRPLVAATNDVEEEPVLTPAHFISGGTRLLLPVTTVKGVDFTAWARLREQLLTSLWKRFKDEYLMYLRSVNCNRGVAPMMKVGDVVILEDGAAPRAQWKLARIVELFPGRDGVARSATIKTATGATYKRSVKSLIALEEPGHQLLPGEPVAARPVEASAHKRDDAREEEADADGTRAPAAAAPAVQ